MAITENYINLYEEHAEIDIVHKNYQVQVLMDREDVSKITKLRMLKSGYISTSKGVLLSRLVTQCPDEMVVDHINGDKLDNRKSNLRIVNQSINERNKHTFIRNNTGTIGVQYRENGNYRYYRVSWRELDGKRKTKQFNINKLGQERAFEQAVELLNEMKLKNGYIIK